MKKIFLIFLIFSLIFIYGQNEYEPRVLVRVGYIDIDKIMNGYLLTQQYQELYETMKNNQYKKLEPIKERIEMEVENLKYNEITLTYDEIEKKWNSILNLKLEYQSMKNKIDEILQQQENQFNDEILKNIYNAIKDIAMKYGFNIILEKKQIYFSTPDVDLSNLIIERLNSDYIKTKEFEEEKNQNSEQNE